MSPSTVSDYLRARRRWAWALALVLALCLGIGVVIGNDYGVSSDEVLNAAAGESAAAAYLGIDQEYPYNPAHLLDHGPAYFIFWSSAGRLISNIDPMWGPTDARHLFNFAVFLVGGAVFFVLCLWFLQPRSAFLASLLFVFQPMLFGQGFINQKDVPFMVLFMAAMTIGVSSIERLRRLDLLEVDHGLAARAERSSLRKAAADDWQRLRTGGRIARGILATALVALAIDMLVMGFSYSWGVSVLREVYVGDGSPWIGELFARIATDAYKTPLELYLGKYDYAYRLVRLFALPAIAVALMIGFGHDLRSLRARLMVGRQGAYPLIVLAGGVLGVAVCVRQIGLFGGALVSAYLVYRLGRRGLPAMGVYWAMAILAMYATWPYLWAEPVGRFWESIHAVTGVHYVDIMYRGQLVDADELPWHYVPTLMSLELTEPALLLCLLGLPITALRLRAGTIPWSLAAICALWVAVPVGAVMLSIVTVYDNLRHLLFVLPPLFVACGVGLDAVLNLARSRWLKLGVILVVLLPGIVGILRMHPYEYSYFNSLTGSVRGGYGGFDADPWCTSLREAVEVVNERSDHAARVNINIRAGNARPFMREDLVLESGDEALPYADYVLTCRYALRRDWASLGFSRVYQVRRGEAVLGEVWARARKGMIGE